jgi:hypothetical protein
MNIKRIGVYILAPLAITISIGAICTKSVNESNTTLVSGTFNSIEQHIGTGRASGSIYYSLFVDNTYYPIGADNSDCFSYDMFQNEVRPGQPIKIYVNDQHQHWFSGTPVIVAIMADNTTYLSFDCVNNEIGNERVWIPLYCIGLFLVVVGYNYLRRNKPFKKE